MLGEQQLEEQQQWWPAFKPPLLYQAYEMPQGIPEQREVEESES